MYCKMNLSNLKKTKFIGKKAEPVSKWTDSNRQKAESYTK